ncbi:MAG: DUF998 domain-containing protein [Thermoplasmata archaeon]|nr:DUF998 domain-containing protein [Thermoplasmata archaeon]
MVTLGPLVRRSARAGGGLLVVGSLQFVAAMGVVQYAHPGYSIRQNAVSDLGGSHSPWAVLFNLSSILLGLLTLGAVLLIRSAFRKGKSSKLALGLLALASVGAIGIGVFPEGSRLHGSFAELAFLASAVSLLFFSLAMLRDTRWDGYRLFTFAAGLVTFLGILLYGGPSTLGLGPGGAERVLIAPILLWGVVAGAHLLRLPSYRASPVNSWESDAGAA